MNSLLFFAATEPAAEGGLLGALGIDIRLLVVQALAFLVLLWILSKFVYPVLSSMLDKREATIRDGLAAAEKARQKATEANSEVEKLLDEARHRASSVLASAKEEAASIVASANESATVQTERMLKKASSDIEKEVEAARHALRAETMELVALATEKVVGKTVTPDVDKKVIAAALKDIE